MTGRTLYGIFTVSNFRDLSLSYTVRTWPAICWQFVQTASMVTTVLQQGDHGGKLLTTLTGLSTLLYNILWGVHIHRLIALWLCSKQSRCYLYLISNQPCRTEHNLLTNILQFWYDDVLTTGNSSSSSSEIVNSWIGHAILYMRFEPSKAVRMITGLCEMTVLIWWWIVSLSKDSAPWSLLNKFVTVILINKQFCVLKVTKVTIAATSDGATREGEHENIMDVSCKWIWSVHAE